MAALAPLSTDPNTLFRHTLTPLQLTPPAFPAAHYNNGGDNDPGATLVPGDRGFHPLLDDLPGDLLLPPVGERANQRPLMKRILRLFRARVTDGIHFFPWHIFLDRVSELIDPSNLLPANSSRHSTEVRAVHRSSMLVHRGCRALKESVGHLHTASGRTTRSISWTIFFNQADIEHWEKVMEDEAQAQLRKHFHHSTSQVFWEHTKRGVYNLRIRYTLRADRCVLAHQIGSPLPHYYEAGDMNEWFIRPGFAEVPVGEKGECSHICLSGDESCVLAAHLVFEPHYINVQREACYRVSPCTRNGCGLILPNPDPQRGYCVGHPQPYLPCLAPQTIPHDRLCSGHEGTWTLGPKYKNTNRMLPPVAPCLCPVRRDPALHQQRTPPPPEAEEEYDWF
jgi:hypothetical protein